MRVLRRVAPIAVLLTILASVTGVVPASATTLPPTAAIVGNSFASGEGGTETGPYLAGSDTPTDQCHRSRTSPGELLAQFHLVRVVANAACSGATAANLTSVSRYGEPPQVDQLPANVRLVYVEIGGNDISGDGVGFGAVVGCLLLKDCDQTPLLAVTLQFIQHQFGSVLDTAYDAIHSKAPRAQVVVTLYPPLLPQSGSDLTQCPQLNPAEVDLGNQIQAAANAVITARAQAHGFRVADAGWLFHGHDVCSGSQSFFYAFGAAPFAATWHPNLSGRVALAIAAGAASL